MGMVTRNGVLEMIVIELSILVVDAILYDGCGMAEVGVGSKIIVVLWAIFYDFQHYATQAYFRVVTMGQIVVPQQL